MVRHMKILLTIICLVLVSSYSYSEEITSGKIVKTNGIVYEINPKSLQKFIFEETYTPFNGTVLYSYEKGQLRSRENYQDGLLDGLGEDFFENGQLEWRINWREGKANGLWEEFFANNQLMTTGTFTNGIMDGLWESFYENGNVFERGTLSNGIKEGLFEEFNENGALINDMINVEYRFPIWKNIGGEFFIDCGRLYDEINYFTSAQISWDYGIGLIYKTTLGPIRIDIGFPYGDLSQAHGVPESGQNQKRALSLLSLWCLCCVGCYS